MQISIIGGGLAGLSAAIEAIISALTLEIAVNVVIFDKGKKLGGNSRKASSGINILKSETQRKNKVHDTFELFNRDTSVSALGKFKNSKIPEFREALITTLVKESEDAYEFLKSNGNIDLSVLSKCGGHSIARTHRATPRPDGRPSNIGNDIVTGLLKFLVEGKHKDLVEIKTNSKVTSLVFDKEYKEVEGVKYLDANGKEQELDCDAVIITTGGFGYNDELLKKHSEFLKKSKYLVPTTNGAWSTGDGLDLGTKLNAQLMDMGEIQLHPTAPEALRAYGGILFNLKGERFVNELNTRDFVSQAIFDNCIPLTDDSPVVSFLLLNEEIEVGFNKGAVGFYKKFGLIKHYKNLREISQAYKIPYNVLEKTVLEYNSITEKYKGGKKVTDKFGKNTFNSKFDINAQLSLALVTPSVHYTMGGLLINKDARVLDKENIPIKQLYAAGEVTGGVHGKNRLAGNSLLDCVVYGRIAGKTAAIREWMKQFDTKPHMEYLQRKREELAKRRRKRVRMEL